MTTETVAEKNVVEQTLDIMVSHPGELMAEIEATTDGKRFQSIAMCADELVSSIRQEGTMHSITPDAIRRRNCLDSANIFLHDQLNALNYINNLLHSSGIFPNQVEEETNKVIKETDKKAQTTMDIVDIILLHPSKVMGLIRSLHPNQYFQNIEQVAQSICMTLNQPNQQFINAVAASSYRNKLSKAILQVGDQITAVNHLRQVL